MSIKIEMMIDHVKEKNKDYKMYSNFGITKGFFATDGDKIGDFIGT